MPCDLHTHSTFSDGSFTPAQLILEAKRLGLMIALTDHNTVSGLPEFMAEAERQGVTAVPGVELSTDWEGTELHLLGLFVPAEHYETVEKLMEHHHRLKERSNLRLVERLREAGYGIDYAAVKRRNATGNVNRAHVAQELAARGHVASVKEAFDTLLAEEAGFYVPPERLGLMEAIRFLRSINAVPVLAHPLQELTPEMLERLLPAAKEAGLLGMEVWHSSYSEEKLALAPRLAERFGLLPAGGSDFHGSCKPDVCLGTGKGNLSVPDRVCYDLLTLSRSLSQTQEV